MVVQNRMRDLNPTAPEVRDICKKNGKPFPPFRAGRCGFFVRDLRHERSLRPGWGLYTAPPGQWG